MRSLWPDCGCLGLLVVLSAGVSGVFGFSPPPPPFKGDICLRYLLYQYYNKVKEDVHPVTHQNNSVGKFCWLLKILVYLWFGEGIMRAWNKCLWIREIPVKVWLTMDKLHQFWKNYCLHGTFICLYMVLTEFHLHWTWPVHIWDQATGKIQDFNCWRRLLLVISGWYLLASDWRATVFSYRYLGSSFPCFDIVNAKKAVCLIKILLQEFDIY